jgi:hypothetical protein
LDGEVMEELGRINIDINESGAAGVGAGAVSDEPTVKRVRSAAQKLAEALERLGRIQQIQYQRQMDPLMRQADVAQGFMSFARRPSVGSALDLIRPDSDTGKAIAKLGKDAGVVAGSLLAVGVAASTLKFAFEIGVKTFRFFERSMESALARIRDLTALSGSLSMLEATRQTQNLMMQFEELNKNSASYLKLATLNLTYEREKARMNIQLNRISAELGVSFQYMMIAVFRMTEKLAASVPPDLDQKILNALTGFGPTGMGGIPFIVQTLIRIGMGVDAIEKNTKPKIDFAMANEWAMKDIKTMTGRAY